MKQTTSSIERYKGGNPATIEKMLRLQSRSVLDGLMKEMNATSIKDLVLKLSEYDNEQG